jgi:hypothetical protein
MLPWYTTINTPKPSMTTMKYEGKKKKQITRGFVMMKNSILILLLFRSQDLEVCNNANKKMG